MTPLMLTTNVPPRLAVELGVKIFNDGQMRCHVCRAHPGYTVKWTNFKTHITPRINIRRVPYAAYPLEQRIQGLITDLELKVQTLPYGPSKRLGFKEMSTFAAPLIAADSFFTAR